MIELGIPGLANVERIGAGGNAVVYRARQNDLDRSVVVKVLTNLDEQTTRRRFDRERKAMGRLSQVAGIAPLYGSGFTPNGQPYLLMPFYEQGSLQDRLSTQVPLPVEEVRQIGITISHAVHTAHENRVLHRDIKPANILVSGRGKTDVADFGIAHLVDDALGTSQALTMTPLYTAPEVFDGKDAGVPGDVYSLGATLFALLRGYPAFGDKEGTTPVLALMRRINEDPLPELPATVPAALESVIGRAMSKNPTDRQASAQELARQLEAVDMSAATTMSQKRRRAKPASSGSSERTRRSGLPVAAVVAALVVLLGVVGLAVLISRAGDETVSSNGVPATAVPAESPVGVPSVDAGADVDDEPEPAATPTVVSVEFDTAVVATLARDLVVRVEAFSCAGVDVATGVVLDDGTVVTTSDVFASPWHIAVSTRDQTVEMQPVVGPIHRGLGLLETASPGAAFAARPVVSVSHGELVAIVGSDGRPAVAEIVALSDPRAPLQAVVVDTVDGNPVEPVDAVLTDQGALVGVAVLNGDTIEVLSPAEVSIGEVTDLDFDCAPTSDSDLGTADIESVLSPAIAELLTMQQLSNAYAGEQWNLVRVLEPGKRSWTDQQFISGWRPLRQGFVYPVDREVDADGQARWRIGLIGYETWSGSDLTTLFCLTWTVDPVSGSVVQTNEDNVIIYGSQPGQERRAGFIRPATLVPLIADSC